MAATAAVAGPHVWVDVLLCLGVVPGEEEGGEARVVALGAVGAAEPLLEHLERDEIKLYSDAQIMMVKSCVGHVLAGETDGPTA